MSTDRIALVAGDLIESIRDVLRKHGVTFDEYRAGFMFLKDVAEQREIPLLLDLFLNSTVVELEAQRTRGSRPAIEGPYFREGAPFVEKEIRIREEDQQPPLIIRGKVEDSHGKALAGAIVDIWHSSPDGRYSGVHDNIPIEYYRGKVRIDESGEFEVRTILPVPYQIPNQGPVGRLLELMGRHSWRPAHIHFKVRKDGYKSLTTQRYFEGGEYVEDDCADGVHPELVVPERLEDGAYILEAHLRVDRAD